MKGGSFQLHLNLGTSAKPYALNQVQMAEKTSLWFKLKELVLFSLQKEAKKATR